MEVSAELHIPPVLPLGKNPGTHWIGGWVWHRASLEGLEKRKVSCPNRIWNLDCPAHSLVAILSRLLRLHMKRGGFYIIYKAGTAPGNKMRTGGALTKDIPCISLILWPFTFCLFYTVCTYSIQYMHMKPNYVKRTHSTVYKAQHSFKQEEFLHLATGCWTSAALCWRGSCGWSCQITCFKTVACWRYYCVVHICCLCTFCQDINIKYSHENSHITVTNKDMHFMQGCANHNSEFIP
jgi:hypothetical protein